jgi:hypothetical protein
MIKTKFSWNEYFSSSPTTTLNSTEYNSQRSYSSGNIYVLNCLFNSFTSTSDGGALFCSSSVTYLLLESSSFFSCKTSDSRGGAIFVSNSNNCQCVLYGVCGNDCCSTRSGGSSFQFALIHVYDGASNKNYVNYSSISRCLNERSATYYMLCLEYGKIFCPSVNMSMNKCYQHSGIDCYPSIDSSSVTCSISYSTFADNIVSDCICNYFSIGSAKYDVKCYNILRNTHVSNSYGIIYAAVNLKIEDSCILENTANYIFYSGSSSYTITLSNCTVDKISSDGYLTIQNTVTKSFILGLNHISTQNCHSEYDSAGTLTVIPYISYPTKKTFCYYHTCKNHYQARIGDLFSLALVFKVAFINPNPPDDY